MQSLVVKALSKYFQIFINDFKKEQFSVSVLQGKGQLTNLSLNEKVVQELLLIPPNLKVLKASCTELTVKIPSFTKLNKIPVVLTLSDVQMEVDEPLEIEPMPNILSKLRKEASEKSKKDNKSGSSWDIFNNLKVEVKEVRISVRTLGRQQISKGVDTPLWRPEFRIDLANVLIHSTNSNWQVVAGEKSDSGDPQFDFDYKQILCSSFSMSLVTGKSRDELRPILKDIPDVEIRYCAKVDKTENKYVAVTVETSISELNLLWDESQYHLMIELFASLHECFERDVPLNDDLLTTSAILKKRLKTLKSIDFQYILAIKKFLLELKEESEQNQKGFEVSATELKLSISPRKRVQLEGEKKKSEQNETSTLDFLEEVFKYGKDKLYESKMSVEFSSVSFNEKTYQDNGVVSQTPVIYNSLPTIRKSDSPSQSNSKSPSAFVFNIVHHWKKLSQPASTKISLYFQLILDRTVFLKLTEILSRHPFPEYAPLEGTGNDFAEEDVQDEPKEEESQPSLLNKMGLQTLKQWYDRSQLFLKMSDIIVYLPFESDRKRTLCFSIPSVTLNTQPDWSRVPYLTDGLSLISSAISHSSYQKYLNNDLPTNKFQATIENISISIPEDNTTLLQPTTCSLFGRLVDLSSQSTESSPVLQMELTAYMDNIEFSISPNDYCEIERLVQLYTEWVEQLQNGRSTNLKSLAMIEKASLELAKEKTLEFKSIAQRDALSAIELMLNWFRFAVSFYANKGVISLPIKKIAYLAEGVEESAQPDDKNDLSPITFENLELALENSENCQQGVVRIKTVQGTELYLPKSPANMFIVPISYTDKSGYAISFSLQRIGEQLQRAPRSKVLARFQNMQVLSKARTNLPAEESLKATVIYLQNLANMLSHFLWTDKARKRFEIAAKSLAYFDLSWEFDMGNCEVLMYESLSAASPYTTLRLANFQKDQFAKQFIEMENQLIETKLRLATSETERDELRNQIKDLQEELNKTRKTLEMERAKAKKELQNLEQQLISAKLALVEAQTSNH